MLQNKKNSRKIDTVGEENQCEIKEQPTEEVEKEERKISEETFWSKKMSNFKQSLNK